MSLKKFLAHLWEQIKHVFNSVEEETRKLVPIAIHIVEAIKRVEDTSVPDLINAFIPGDADDKLNAWIRAEVPKALVELNMIQSIANITDLNAQVKAIIDAVKLSSKTAQDAFYHSLASLLLEKLSDGKFSWSDAVAVAEFWYQNEYKNK